MLSWSIIFLVMAVIAGILGFSGVQVVSIEIARLTFYIFLVLFFVSAVGQAWRGKGPPA